MKAHIKIPLLAVLLWISAPGYTQVRVDSIKPWSGLTPGDSIILERLEVSGPMNDYAPVIVAGNRLFFTSDRKNNPPEASVLNYNENTYYTTFSGNTWKDAKKFYFFNTDDHTAVAGVADQGNSLYLYKTFENGDLYVSKLKEDQWKSPVTIGDDLNSEGHEQSIAKAGKYLVIASDRSGGKGEHDIYFAVIDATGIVGGLQPATLLNTAADEVDVRLSKDGKQLYFSSNRIDSLGYDIYFSEPDSNGQWKAPQRLMEPLNSVADDRWFFDADTIFILSSNRPGGAGGDDLYKGAVYKAPEIPVIELPYATRIDTMFVVESVIEAQPNQDTVHQDVQNTPENIASYLDSMGVKNYVAMVQIGAFYNMTVPEFRTHYPSLKAVDIIAETGVKPNGKKITRFLVNKIFVSLEEAAKLQNEMIKVHKIRDSFVAIYDTSGKRIAIYNSFTGEFIMLNQ